MLLLAVKIASIWVIPTLIGFWVNEKWRAVQHAFPIKEAHLSDKTWNIIGYVGAAGLVACLGLLNGGFVSPQSLWFAIPYLLTCVVGLFSAIGRPNPFTIVVETTIALQTIANITLHHMI